MNILTRISTLLALFLLVTSQLLAQQGSVREGLTFQSSILEKKVNYSIYLPPNYDDTNREYPVLYLLHGYTDNEDGWIQFGQVKKIVDRQHDNIDVSEMVIVMPDAGVSWYINSHDGDTRYEDFFVDEFIPGIDSTYRTRSSKEFRAVAGLSMGGYGTLILALKHHELFTAAAPLSAAVFLDEEIEEMDQETWDGVFQIPFEEGLTGKQRFTDHYRQNSILDIVENGNADSLNTVDYYIDCGDDDFLVKGNMALHSAMIDKEIEHEFRIRDGGHTWDYWRSALPQVLTFVSQSFHR
ncbi:alpha/beta hydrolase [Halalkalibaculum sp. DA3122]|uniref:alpha/beta hydrolase n=1 Tax=Halalkalibaculum sp. DA3122 TaxID=3373607 RepID=UPI003754280C